MKINIKKLTTTAKIPTRGSEYAAGYDLYADITKELVIEPHETAKIGTGLSIEIPDGYFGAVCQKRFSCKAGTSPGKLRGCV